MLRVYQIQGVGWVDQRLGAGRGALLADDMGLGKTVQTIAALLLRRNDKHSSRRPDLVVCPKSLIPNWVEEFAKFAPDLRVLPYQGSPQERQKAMLNLDAHDIIITSYQLISNDLESIKKLQFGLVVLDEASFIRNPDTAMAKAVCQLASEARLALTGTPIENGVRDLWSIFHFLMPGYLGSRSHFQERFEKPLSQASALDASAAGKSASSRLKRLVRPFFLRRTKREVLTELPEKIEQVLWCDMTASQGEAYRVILDQGREEIRMARRRSGQKGARMTMLSVLLRLRQVCCDLRLAGLDVKDLPEDEWSGKRVMLRDRLREIRVNQGTALIFSQFVEHLTLCREIVEAESLTLSYLDGSTQNRGEVVKTFQSDPCGRIFLISLKAGGYGLNLTQADQVYLLDPWWNPAVESQAIDRAHRFGQNRAVNAFRLITRGTVEEKILELQRKKKNVMVATIEDRAPMMEGLTEADLEEILG